MVVVGAAILAGKIAHHAHANDWVLDALTGTLLFIAGYVERYRRPAFPRVGDVLILAGFLWFCEDLNTIYTVPTKTLGPLFAEAPTPLFIWLVLTFPSGKMQGILRRALTAGICFASWIITPLTDYTYVHASPDNSQDRFRIHTSQLTANRIGDIGTCIEIPVIALVALILVVGLVQAQSARRLVILPVYVASLAGTAMSGALTLAENLPLGLSGATLNSLHLLSDVTVLLLPAGFLLASLRLELNRSRLAMLLSVDNASLSPEIMQEELRMAVRDKDLMLVKSADGEPAIRPGRVVVEILRTGQALGWLDLDAVLVESGTMLSTLLATSSACLRQDALARSAESHLAELQAHRMSLESAVDDARRQVERDLHDGAQQTLVSATLALRRALNAPADEREHLLQEVDARLQASLAELREMARGFVPPLLAEKGLASALLSLRERAPITMEVSGLTTERLPAHIERVLYYVVAECVTNCVKHAEARAIDIELDVRRDAASVCVSDDGNGAAWVRDGGGLSGLRDRVEAIGGELTLESAAGRGTVVFAQVPMIEVSSTAGQGERCDLIPGSSYRTSERIN